MLKHSMVHPGRVVYRPLHRTIYSADSPIQVRTSLTDYVRFGCHLDFSLGMIAETVLDVAHVFHEIPTVTEADESLQT